MKFLDIWYVGSGFDFLTEGQGSYTFGVYKGLLWSSRTFSFLLDHIAPEQLLRPTPWHGQPVASKRDNLVRALLRQPGAAGYLITL